MRSPVTLLKDAWGIFSSNPKLFLGIYLIPAIIGFAFELYFGAKVDQESVMSSEQPLIFAAALIVLIVANILMGIALVKAVANPSATTVGGAYREAKKYFLPYVLISLMVGVVVFFGLALLIIPGIIFAVWFSFAYFALIFEDKRGVEAMKVSKEYVKGKWWAVFGRYAFLLLIAILISVLMGIVATVLESGLENIGTAIASFVFSAVMVPVVTAYTYLMYKDVSTSAPSSDVPQVEDVEEGE